MKKSFLLMGVLAALTCAPAYASFCGMEVVQIDTEFCVWVCEEPDEPVGSCWLQCHTEISSAIVDQLCDSTLNLGNIPSASGGPCYACCSGDCAGGDPNDDPPYPPPDDPGVDADGDGIGDCVTYVLGSDNQQGLTGQLGDSWGGPQENSCHPGDDVECTEDDPVYALQQGIVWQVTHGDSIVEISFAHPVTGEMWLARYGHLNEASVTEDDLVVAGTQIGVCGDRLGDAGDFHVHYEIMREIPAGGQPIAPECNGEVDPDDPDDPLDDFEDNAGNEYLDPETLHTSCPI